MNIDFSKRFTDFGSSSFWMPSLGRSIGNLHDPFKLAQHKRAISNFVTILTGKNYEVKFNTKDQSYTDGNVVTIGSKIDDPKEFDIAVGLALHEASHLKLSDFNILKDFIDDFKYATDKTLLDAASDKGVTSDELLMLIKNMWNYVEDRRIDNYVFTRTPGYRDYYRSMYDRYFNSKVVDKALLSNEYTDETLESYMFRVINLHNPNSKRNKLKALGKIYKTIDLMNIDRLKSTSEARDVAIEVTKIIIDALPDASKQSQEGGDSSDNNNQQSQSNDGSSSGGSGETSDSESSEPQSEKNDAKGGSTGGDNNGSTSSTGDSDEDDGDTSGNDNDGSEAGEGDESNEGSDSGEGDEDVPELTDRQKKQIKKDIENQKKFLDGDVSKKNLDSKIAKEVDKLNEAGIKTNEVGNDYDAGMYSGRTTKLVEITNMSDSIIKSNILPIANYSSAKDGPYYDYSKYISDGISLGRQLGKRLQVRGESRTTEFNRQRNGRIDKRMISQLGFGQENVFKYTDVDQYKKANLHISLDGSSSMNTGEKWENTVKTTTAIVQAVEMIDNLEVQVSVRSTKSSGPYLVWLYDSRKNKLNQFKKWISLLRANGTTPEGLCFEGMLNSLLPTSNEVDSYFLNISDGEPYMYSSGFHYSGHAAAEHTRKQVNKIRGLGIKVLSYFVSGSPRTSHKAFDHMYGKDARYIDHNHLNDIVKTLNKLFLSK